MINGGVLNGALRDPVTFLLGSLHAKFSALEEESRLSAMTEMLAFARRPSESIDALLARYEVVRQRAAIDGQFAMTIEGCSLQLLRACGTSTNQLYFLLQPFDNKLPTTEAQYNQMVQQLRRQRHSHEHVPGNIATALQGPHRQARAGAYHANPQDYQDAFWRTDGPTYQSKSKSAVISIYAVSNNCHLRSHRLSLIHHISYDRNYVVEHPVIHVLHVPT